MTHYRLTVVRVDVPGADAKAPATMAKLAPYHRVCGRRYPGGWCDRLPDHAGPHTGDMGPHALTDETRRAWDFGDEVTQTRAVCVCGWRSAWYTDARHVEIPRRQHEEEAK